MDKLIVEPVGIHVHQLRSWNNALLPPDEEIIIKDFIKDGNVIGHAVIRKKRIKYTSFNYLRVLFGPVISYSSADIIRQVFYELKELALENKSIYIEVQPYTWNYDADILLKELSDLGYKKAFNHLYKATILIDLSQSEDEIFKAFERRGQKAIRQAESRGITVSQVEMNEDNFKIFYQLYVQTCSRTSFIPEPFDMLKTQLLYFGKQNAAVLFFAYEEVKAVGALVAFNNGVSLSTVYQGNDYTPEVINKRPSNAMYWYAVKWAKQQGINWFDFGGITVTEEQEGNEKKQGIHNFKEQFGGRIVKFPGNFRYVNRPILNFILSMLVPVYSMIALRKK